MKKLLNIVLGEISTGELGIALAFSKALDKNRYENYYLIPDTKLSIMGQAEDIQIMTVSRKQEPVKNCELIISYIKENDIDAFLLFDAFTLEYSQEWTGINFEYLKSLQIPIISLDEYEYTKAGYKLDYYGIFIKRLPALLDKCDYVIKNCPLSMVDSSKSCMRQGSRKNEYYYRVFEEMPRISCKEREQVRKDYVFLGAQGLPRDAKVVCFTTSQWEMKGAYAFSCQNTLASWLGVILHEYLKELDEDIILLHIGTERWKIEAVDEKVRYVHYDSLPVETFEKVIQAAELFVTFNLVSITLSKAVMFGVPSLVLNNSKIIEFGRLQGKLAERPKWYQDMARDVKKIYPFTASMFGWGNFLKTVLTDNSYVDTFERVEMFNYKKTKDMLRDMLMNQEKRQKLVQKNETFIQNYQQLMGADEVLDDIFQQISEKEGKTG